MNEQVRHIQNDDEEEEEDAQLLQHSNEPDGWRLQGFHALLVFMAINFLSYYDRGAVAGGLSSIKKDPNFQQSDGTEMSDTDGGMVVSSFMLGFMIFSPIFAASGGIIKPAYIVFTGLCAWMAATIFTSLSNTYWMLVISRCFIGIGEAAYCGYIPTMIDDMAPGDKRTMWIGLYFAMIPVGMAVGMAAGGVISSGDGALVFKGWQLVFATECFPMIPLSLLILRLPKHLGTGHNPDKITSTTKLQSLNPAIEEEAMSLNLNENSTEYPTAWKAIRNLLANPLFLLTALGYAMYTFVIGGISAWGIVYLEQGPLQMGSAWASITFGGVTAVSGLLGTAAGGWFVDSLGGSKGYTGMIKCHKFNIVNVAVSIPAGIVAFMMTKRGLFFPICFISEVALFATTAPINSIVLETVPTDMRTYAMSFTILLIHGLGDFPSPLLIGAVSDSLGTKCKVHHNEATCDVDTENSCSWTDTGDTCRNQTQLRDALLLVFALLVCGGKKKKKKKKSLAPILWLVALRLTVRKRNAVESE